MSGAAFLIDARNCERCKGVTPVARLRVTRIERPKAPTTMAGSKTTPNKICVIMSRPRNASIPSEYPLKSPPSSEVAYFPAWIMFSIMKSVGAMNPISATPTAVSSSLFVPILPGTQLEGWPSYRTTSGPCLSMNSCARLSSCCIALENSGVIMNPVLAALAGSATSDIGIGTTGAVDLGRSAVAKVSPKASVLAPVTGPSASCSYFLRSASRIA